MAAAIERDGAAQQALMTGDEQAAAKAFGEASDLYRESWESAPPGSYGRLVGMLKAAVLAGSARDQAAYVRRAFGGDAPESPTAAYALALAALIEDDDEAGRACAARMGAGSGAFERTARAITALADRDAATYADAVEAIVRDFEQRADHLTGVAIADTALVLQRLAEERGIALTMRSPVMPDTTTSA